MNRRMIFYAAAIIGNADGSGFSVSFYDFPEISTSGQTVRKAISNAEQSLKNAISQRIKLKSALPFATSLEDAKIAVRKEFEKKEEELPEDSIFLYIPAPIALLYGLGQVYDSTSKRIFGFKEAFWHLLQHFVPESLLPDVHYDSLEKQPETFITSQLGELRDDVIWRVQTQGREPFYIYLLTEFQSTVYYYMAARISEYVGELRMDLLRSGVVKNGEKLPIIFPIVIYRGTRKWNAPLGLNAIQSSFGDDPSFFSQQDYFLIDIHTIAEESLNDKNNIAVIFFLMERAKTWDALQSAIRDACVHFSGEQYRELRNTFLYWCIAVGIPRLGFQSAAFPNCSSLEELAGMAYAYADKEEEEYYTQWIKDIQTKAFNDGEKSGFSKGEISGFSKGEISGFSKGANSTKKECSKKLASMGVDTNLLMDAFGLTPKEMQGILSENA